MAGENAEGAETASETGDAQDKNYYLVTRVGVAAVKVEYFAQRDDLVETVSRLFEEARSGEQGTSQSAWIFEGKRVKIVGDPLRSLEFPDGTRIPISINDDSSSDDKILPPSLRGMYAGAK